MLKQKLVISCYIPSHSFPQRVFFGVLSGCVEVVT